MSNGVNNSTTIMKCT